VQRGAWECAGCIYVNFACGCGGEHGLTNGSCLGLGGILVFSVCDKCVCVGACLRSRVASVRVKCVREPIFLAGKWGGGFLPVTVASPLSGCITSLRPTARPILHARKHPLSTHEATLQATRYEPHIHPTTPRTRPAPLQTASWTRLPHLTSDGPEYQSLHDIIAEGSMDSRKTHIWDWVSITSPSQCPPHTPHPHTPTIDSFRHPYKPEYQSQHYTNASCDYLRQWIRE
jgi:hypothetical protein